MPEQPALMTEAIIELVAIGSATARNCEPCFKFHFDRARKLGVSVEDMRKAVNAGISVKFAPHRKAVETAERYLSRGVIEGEAVSCCSGEPRG